MRRLTYAALPVAAALALSWAAVPAFASGTSYTWVGSSQNVNADNHSWTDSRNWSPSGVPGTGDSVSIAAPDGSHCTAHVDNVPTASLTDLSINQSAQLCGVSINGGDLTVTGAFTWNGGDIETPLTIAAGAAGTVSGSNSRLNIIGQPMNVAGSLTLSAVTGNGASNTGALRINSPQVLHVLSGGTLTSSGSNDVTFTSCCIAPAKIVNDGTMNVANGDLHVAAVEVDQNGELNASSGGRLVTTKAPLTAGDGAVYTGNGGWLISDGGKVKFSGTQTLGADFHVELGGLAVNAGAAFGGAATFAGSGTIDWTGGTMEGNTTIGHGVTVQVSGAHTDNGRRQLSGVDVVSNNAAATFTNHGTINVDNGATVGTGGPAHLVNATDGTITLAPGTQFASGSCCVNPDQLVNNGVLAVPTATSTSPAELKNIAYKVSGGGSTSIAAGQQLLVDGGAPGALSTTTVSGGGTLTVATPMAVSGTVTIGSGTKLALQTHGSLNGTATINGAGSLPWTGGSFSGKVTVTATGGTAISGTDQKYVSNVNGGSTTSTLSLKSKTSVAAGTSATHNVINLGQSTLSLDSTTSVATFVDVYAGTLVNTGSLTVNPGSGGAVHRTGSGPFTNRGTVGLKSGRFVVTGVYTQTAGVTDVAAGASFERDAVSHPITIGGGALQGAGTIGAGVVNNAGTVKPAGSGTGTLHISGTYTQGAKGTLALDLAGNSRDLVAVKGAVTMHGKVTAHNVGSYNPALGTRFRVLSGASFTGGPSCAITSGGGSGGRHWEASDTSTGLILIWRNGRHTSC
jgi:filamentous hemagglutinin